MSRQTRIGREGNFAGYFLSSLTFFVHGTLEVVASSRERTSPTPRFQRKTRATNLIL
jgi:hypothetical protein